MVDKNEMSSRAARIAQSSLHRTAREAADRATGKVDISVWIEVERIQVRVGGLNAETVERYATVMLENEAYEPFPPVVVFREDDTLWLSAGFHRIAAAHQVGLAEVRAEMRPGSFEDAYWFAITDNLSNGLQMSNIDQKEALRRLLGLDIAVPEAAEYVTMSDRQLAAIIGVHHKTIGRWRSELEESTGAHAPVDSRIRVGADGKVRDVSGIQAANQQRVQEPDEPAESPRRAEQPREFTPEPDYSEPVVNLDDAEPAGQWEDWSDEPDEPPLPPSAPRPATASQDPVKRQIVNHLRAAADGLRRLRDQVGHDSIQRYADDLAQEWGLE